MASDSKQAVSKGAKAPAPQDDRDNTTTASAAANDENNNNAADGERSSEDDNVRDEKAGPGPTKWQKMKAHFWRFKWWYLLALVILLAILLPLLFKVIIPAIIKAVLKSQDLPIKGGGITAITPDTIEMSLDTSLHCPLPVNIDELHLELFNKDVEPVSPFLGLTLPPMHLSGTKDVNLTDQLQTVTNMSQLTQWFSEYFDRETISLSVRGKPRIHLGALAYDSDLDKTIELPGLNYLKGFTPTSMEFMLKSNDTEYNIKGLLNIPNAGVLYLGLGDLKFNVVAGDVRLGLFSLFNVTLLPGNNSVPFQGQFYFDQLIPNLKAVLDSQKEALGRGVLQLYTTGNSTTVDGVAIPYFQNLLNSKRIPFEVPVITLLADVLGGILGADQSSLMDVFGEAIGNSTLFENILDHWDAPAEIGDQGNSNSTTTLQSVTKRQKSSRSFALSLIKLGLKAKAKKQ